MVPLFTLPQLPFSCAVPDRLLDLVHQFGELGLRRSPLLDKAIRTLLKGPYHYLFPPSAGEEEERQDRILVSKRGKEGDPIHSRQLVIGDDRIVTAGFQFLKRGLGGGGGIDPEPACRLEVAF